MGKVLSKINESEINANDVCRISSGVAVNGNIESSTDMRIDGNVEGEIRCDKHVVIGEGGHVNGTLHCERLDCWGCFEGDLFVSELMSLKSGANVNGTFNVNKISIEIGAVITGTIKQFS